MYNTSIFLKNFFVPFVQSVLYHFSQTLVVNFCPVILYFLEVKLKVTQSSPTLCDPMDCNLSGCSVHGDSPGRSTGVGSLSGDLPNPGIEPRSPASQADSLSSELPGKPKYFLKWYINGINPFVVLETCFIEVQLIYTIILSLYCEPEVGIEW